MSASRPVIDLVRVLRARQQLAVAERATLRPWCPRASLRLDRALVAFERVRDAARRAA